MDHINWTEEEEEEEHIYISDIYIYIYLSATSGLLDAKKGWDHSASNLGGFRFQFKLFADFVGKRQACLPWTGNLVQASMGKKKAKSPAKVAAVSAVQEETTQEVPAPRFDGLGDPNKHMRKDCLNHEQLLNSIFASELFFQSLACHAMHTSQIANQT